MRNSIALALAGGHHEAAARGYCNLAELLMRMGRLDELDRCVRDGLAFTRERGFWSHAYNLEVHRCLLLVRRGDWDGALDGLRALVDGRRRPGDAVTPTRSRGWGGCWRGAATRGRARCSPRRGSARSASGCCSGWPTRGSRVAEWAWLAGDVAVARGGRAGAAAAHRAPGRGAVPRRAAALPGARGLEAEPFLDCPPAYAAGPGRRVAHGRGAAGAARAIRTRRRWSWR